MLPIAGQTAGPIGLNFFMDTHGGGYRCKKSKYFFTICFPRATPGPSASKFSRSRVIKFCL